MLYVTTRNHRDAFTVSHVLAESRGEDGGLWLPMGFPVLSREERKNLGEKPFNRRVADLLNLFFGTKLTQWDVDFSVGRYPVRLETFPHKLFAAEFWHNPEWCFHRLESNLLELIEAQTNEPESWCAVAVRMVLLAAVLTEEQELGGGNVDIVTVSGDFSMAVSAWYLRKMGFPVGNVICCCNENNRLWELVCQGQTRTDGTAAETFIPEADVLLPGNLERLISECGGAGEVLRYLRCREEGAVYSLSDAMLTEIRKGFYVSVVSSDRVETAIPNIYHSYRYLMTPASALAYCGLMDYRSKTGNTGSAVILCENSPVCDGEAVAGAMNMTPEELKKLL